MYPKGHIGSTLLVSAIAINFFGGWGLLFAVISTLYTLSPDIDQALNPIVDIEKISHSIIYVSVIPIVMALLTYGLLTYIGADSYVNIREVSIVMFLSSLSGAITHLLMDALTEVSSEITWPIHIRMSLRLTTPDNKLLNNTIFIIGLIPFLYMVFTHLELIQIATHILDMLDLPRVGNLIDKIVRNVSPEIPKFN